VVAWGEVTGNQSMVNLGAYLYTTDLQSVQTYWFSIDNQTDPFGNATDVIPPQYLGSASAGTQRSLVTKLNGSGGGYVGFIGFQTSNVAGIQMLPLSGSAYYLGQDPSFVNTTYTLAQKGNTAAGTIPVGPPTYQSVLLPYLALANPAMALSDYQTAVTNNTIAPINPGDLIDNNAFNMHWIEVLNAYGQVDANVTANVPEYTVFEQPSTKVLTFVASNTSAVTENNVQFKDSSGNVLTTETVPAFTTLVWQDSGNNPQIVAQQTTPNFAPVTPQNRFYLTMNGNTPTLSYGTPGKDEEAVTWDGAKPLQFTIKGVSGTLLGQNALTDFSLWLDPGTRTNSSGANVGGTPSVQVTITYDPGAGQPLVTQTYSQFNMSPNAGWVEYRSQQAGGLSGDVQPAPLNMVNGTVTVTITPIANISPTAPIRLRVGAAEQQGAVSYLDLPYALTTAGVDTKDQPIPVSSLDLGGQTLGPPLPDIAGE
jgi:hypothetical protein